jgi:hypothetical protein
MVYAMRRRGTQGIVRYAVAILLVGVSASMVLTAFSDAKTTEFVQSLTLPWGQPDSRSIAGSPTLALVESLVALLLSVAVLTRPSRILFGSAAALAALASATAFSAAVGTPPGLPVAVGPLLIQMAHVTVALIVTAVICLALWMVSWRVLPQDPDRVVHMPPPTHQG